MGNKTGIEWTDKTWNPWRGCHKVSQGCKNCYMFREQKQYGHDPNIVVRSKTTFNDPLKWKEPAKVFVNSWSDFFIEEADPWRDEAWDIMRRTSHIYQVLTKRIENVSTRLPKDWGSGWPNVWLGVSAEDQANADERIPQLLEIPAAIRFVSAEPLLGPISFKNFYTIHNSDDYPIRKRHIDFLDWIIAGGESGPNCRPMDLAWARSIRDQCKEAGVAFFYKQNGGWPNKLGNIPEDLMIRQFPVLREQVGDGARSG